MIPTYPPQRQRHQPSWQSPPPSRSPVDPHDPLLADFPDMDLPDCQRIDHLLQPPKEDDKTNDTMMMYPHPSQYHPPQMVYHAPFPSYHHPAYHPPFNHPQYPQSHPPPPQSIHNHEQSQPLPDEEISSSPCKRKRADDFTSSKSHRKRTSRAPIDLTPLDVVGSIDIEPNSPSPDSESRPEPPQLDENGTLHRYRCYQTDIWSKKFDMLLEYVRDHGHCNVPHAYEANPELAQWVKRQRYQYKLKMNGKRRSTLSDERLRKLDEVGFIWDAHRALWMERYAKLEKYVATRGHCNVPSRSEEHPQLSVWVKCQRRQYRLLKDGDPSSNMTQERIDLLEALGIVRVLPLLQLGREGGHYVQRCGHVREADEKDAGGIFHSEIRLTAPYFSRNVTTRVLDDSSTTRT